MRRDVFVYMSGPITARHDYTVEENVASAVRIYWDLLRRGLPAFCPHLSGAFPTAFSALDYDVWLQYDFAVIDRCTHILMLPRWETSTGAVRERAYAEDRGLPVALTVDELIAQVG